MQLYTHRELKFKFQLTEDEFNTSIQKTKCFVSHHSMEAGTFYDNTALFYLSNIEKFLKYHFPIEFAIENSNHIVLDPYRDVYAIVKVYPQHKITDEIFGEINAKKIDFKSSSILGQIYIYDNAYLTTLDKLHASINFLQEHRELSIEKFDVELLNKPNDFC